MFVQLFSFYLFLACMFFVFYFIFFFYIILPNYWSQYVKLSSGRKSRSSYTSLFFFFFKRLNITLYSPVLTTEQESISEMFSVHYLKYMLFTIYCNVQMRTN